jgi:hypothetical protein
MTLGRRRLGNRVKQSQGEGLCPSTPSKGDAL